MAWPSDDLTNDELDEGTDDPSQARDELNSAVLKIKAIIAGAVAAATANCVVLRDSLGDFASRWITAIKFIGDLAAADGTIVLDSGTDGSNAKVTADILAANGVESLIKGATPNASQFKGILEGTINLGADADEDLYIRRGSVLIRLPKGANGQVLGVSAGVLNWLSSFSGGVGQVVVATTGSRVAIGNGVLPNDDTIPQITEGNQVFTGAITPKKAGNKIIVFHFATLFVAGNVNYLNYALFKQGTADALQAGMTPKDAASNNRTHYHGVHVHVAPDITPITFETRCGYPSATTLYLNGDQLGNRYFGGACESGLIMVELEF